MTDMGEVVTFPSNDKFRWDINRQEAHIDADYGGETILCRVGKRWLSENCRVIGDDYLTAAQEDWNTITDALGPRVKAGAFENDRSVLLK